MNRLNTFLFSKAAIFGILMVMILAAVAAFAFKTSKEIPDPTRVATETSRRMFSVRQAGNAASPESRTASAVMGDNVSKAVLKVSNMSCSGCISTIKSSVAGFQGIKETLVEISSGRVEIYFDAGTLKKLAPVAKAITDSGYPATVLQTFSAAEVRKETARAESRSKYYVASVGGWDIARSDFNTELETVRRRYAKIYGDSVLDSPQGQALLDNLKVQILSRLIDEGIMMQEIVKAGFKIEKEIMARRVQGLIKEHGQNLDKTGTDPEYFKKKVETKILINQYIHTRVLADAANDFEKRTLFDAWFKNSKVLAEVVYYDRELEKLLRRQNASGGCSVPS